MLAEMRNRQYGVRGLNKNDNNEKGLGKTQPFLGIEQYTPEAYKPAIIYLSCFPYSRIYTLVYALL